MNKTAERFDAFLEKKGFPMSIIRVQDRENETLYFFGQMLGEKQVNVLIDFDDDNTCIDLNLFNLARIRNEEQKIKIYDLINNYNRDYRFPKFYLAQDVDDENDVPSLAAQITIPYENPVSEDMIFDMLSSMLSFCKGILKDIDKALE